jgi:3-hydroxyisobutyrate dehydrogenase-like beta-hydroxyacid dehydrogenase
MSDTFIEHIALIGFGEVGGIFASDFAALGVDVSVSDILLRSEPTRTRMLEKARATKARAHDNPGDAIEGALLVISAVTASAAVDAAKEVAGSLRRGQIYLDVNSVSPETKRVIAAHIAPSGAQFVEAAVMGPVPPHRLKVPMLLGGPYAAEAAKCLHTLGMNATAASDQIGVPSAIKMCRSIFIKGMEALAVESLLAARRYGAEQAVIDSLDATYPHMGWRDRLPDYLVSRVAEHGRRRADEMREVARTLESTGLAPLMALATAERQDWLVAEMASRHLTYKPGEPFSWRALADAINTAE